MKIIYLGAEFGFDAVKAFIGQHNVETLHIEAQDDAVANALESVDALLDASMKVRITNEMVRKAGNLKVISCATTGSDHIEREELTMRAIPVLTLKDDPDLLFNLTPAAELSWALLIACARKLPQAFDHVKSGNWVRENFPGIMLRGKQLGLVGCGRIGTWMSRYADGFGMNIVGFDPYAESMPEHVEPVSLEHLFATSDFISVHVHLTDETRGLITRSLLEGVKPECIFINTSRGAIVDEGALVDVLQSGRLGGAGLDVLDGEPDIDTHPLVEYARRHENVIITPHCGGFSPDAVRIVCKRAAQKILDYLAGKVL